MKYIKLTQLAYHKQRLGKVLFSSMCNLCGYAQFLHARSHLGHTAE